MGGKKAGNVDSLVKDLLCNKNSNLSVQGKPTKLPENYNFKYLIFLK